MTRTHWTLALGALAGVSSLAIPLAGAVLAHDLPPPGAHPGECYGRVVKPPAYRTVHKQVLVEPARTERRVVPGLLEKIPHRVLVSPERVEHFRIPAVYRDEVRWVYHDGRPRLVSEPPVYRTVREKVMVEHGHAEWRRSDAPLAYGESRYGGQTELHGTGEVVCRVWVPARWETVERRVKVAPGRSYYVPGPGWRERVSKEVLVRPASWGERRIAAVYRTETETRILKRPHVEVISHPAIYRDVEQREIVGEGERGWSKVFCGGAVSPAFMARVQEALIANGYDPGRPDGEARPQTFRALRHYQRDHGLAEGQLTVETGRALRVW